MWISVVGDTCLAMDEWVQNPTAHTALDELIPCVDNATAQDTLIQTKTVTHSIVNVINNVILNVSNINYPPGLQPLYFNQSGPLMPVVCNPFHRDLTDRQCLPGEVGLVNATKVIWTKHLKYMWKAFMWYAYQIKKSFTCTIKVAIECLTETALLASSMSRSSHLFFLVSCCRFDDLFSFWYTK